MYMYVWILNFIKIMNDFSEMIYLFVVFFKLLYYFFKVYIIYWYKYILVFSIFKYCVYL